MSDQDHQKLGYKVHDLERFVTQPSSNSARRSEFVRDRARVLHSASFRRLSAKTQVLSPDSGDFARTRLTHSLEVSQVGRELATVIGVSPDLVDMACLAHDLGHPPFGHNGESALNEWANDFGGFEGNAQTFRLLTFLEQKVYDNNDVSRGLNLTRASLDAATKYPWTREQSAGMIAGGIKFGAYLEDMEVFDWMRQDAPEGAKSVEAQIMDFSDDVAYSVHDFEDAVVEGFLDLGMINDPSAQPELLREVSNWNGGTLSLVELEEGMHNLKRLPFWLANFDGAPREIAQLKNLTSELIGSFVTRTTDAIFENAAKSSMTRYHSGVIVPGKVKSEIAVLKGIVAVFLMTHESRKRYYENQRELLVELSRALLNRGPDALDAVSGSGWGADETSQHRAVVDHVASLTDSSAVALHRQLVRERS